MRTNEVKTFLNGIRRGLTRPLETLRLLRDHAPSGSLSNRWQPRGSERDVGSSSPVPMDAGPYGDRPSSRTSGAMGGWFSLRSSCTGRRGHRSLLEARKDRCIEAALQPRCIIQTHPARWANNGGTPHEKWRTGSFRCNRRHHCEREQPPCDRFSLKNVPHRNRQTSRKATTLKRILQLSFSCVLLGPIAMMVLGTCAGDARAGSSKQGSYVSEPRLVGGPRRYRCAQGWRYLLLLGVEYALLARRADPTFQGSGALGVRRSFRAGSGFRTGLQPRWRQRLHPRHLGVVPWLSQKQPRSFPPYFRNSGYAGVGNLWPVAERNMPAVAQQQDVLAASEVLAWRHSQRRRLVPRATVRRPRCTVGNRNIGAPHTHACTNNVRESAACGPALAHVQKNNE